MSAENSFMEVLTGGTSSDKTGGSDRGGVVNTTAEKAATSPVAPVDIEHERWLLMLNENTNKKDLAMHHATKEPKATPKKGVMVLEEGGSPAKTHRSG